MILLLPLYTCFTTLLTKSQEKPARPHRLLDSHLTIYQGF